MENFDNIQVGDIICTLHDANFEEISKIIECCYEVVRVTPKRFVCKSLFPRNNKKTFNKSNGGGVGCFGMAYSIPKQHYETIKKYAKSKCDLVDIKKNVLSFFKVPYPQLTASQWKRINEIISEPK